MLESPEEISRLQRLLDRSAAGAALIGTESFDVRVADLQGEERDRLYAAQAEVMPNFAEYQAKTERVIPVVALSRA